MSYMGRLFFLEALNIKGKLQLFIENRTLLFILETNNAINQLKHTQLKINLIYIGI